MQAHPKGRQAAGAADRVLCGGFADHQAGAAQYALAMGDFDRLVDRFVEAEIVRREDDLFQCAT
jgi:hypothetical protein